ncbi:MAG: acetolactate synthase small subunit [Sphingobacteriales bacterium]|nr:acetolactate synthase small subunit [Sphingobacteriales bacterium]
MEQLYTLSVFTENHIGILSRITLIFTRRHINIESLNTSESEVKDVYRYTIVIKTTYEQACKVVNQIEKQIDVLKVFVHTEQEIVHQEIALYKIRTASLINGEVEKIIRENHARILTVENDFMVIEKTGHAYETQALFEKLQLYGVLEFARSGRVAVTKPMKELSSYLKELEMEEI